MRERIDTYQVGPAAPGLIGGLVEDVIPAVLVEARITANGRNIRIIDKETKEGVESISHVGIEYTEDDLSDFNRDKQRTVITEDYIDGIYAP